MTPLYRPVVIESAEQAEALPVGTVAFAAGPLRGACHAKRALGDWTCDSDDGGLESEDVVGWTALVPIEAEEERDNEWADYGGSNRRRLVTPWVEAPAPDEEVPALADCGDLE